MAFTRDWDESTPTDLTYARDIDNYMRNVREDLSDRLKAMVYGLTAGENTLAAHLQFAQFYDQPSVAQPSASYGRLYIKSGELFYQDASGNEKQLTTAGVVTIVGGVDITLATLLATILNDTYLQGLDQAGTGAVDIIKVTATDTLELGAITKLPDESVLATAAAPTADAMLANKKYVDDQLDTRDFGAWTQLDSLGGTLATTESYTASGDGFFYVKFNHNGGGATVYVDGVALWEFGHIGIWNEVMPISAGETISFGAINGFMTVRWKPIGTSVLVKQ